MFRHLLREPTMALDEMQEYCRTMEVIMKHLHLLNGLEETENVNAIKYRKKYTNPSNDIHQRRQCPTYNQMSTLCERKVDTLTYAFTRTNYYLKGLQKKVSSSR